MLTTNVTAAAVAAASDLTTFRDHPDLNCEIASEQLVNICTDTGIRARAVEFEDPRVGGGAEMHVAVHLLDTGDILDVTYRQYDRTSRWPLLEPLATYQARFRTGPRAVELLDRWADAGWDVDGFVADRLAVGAPVPAEYLPDGRFPRADRP